MKTIWNKLTWVVAAVCTLTLLAEANAAHLVMVDGKRIEGSGVRVNASGDYVIKTSAGDRTFPARQVKEAVADKPASYDKVMSLVKAKNYDQAIPALESIASKNRKVGWDDQANKVLGQIYLDQGEGKKAYDSFRKISPAFLQRGDVRPSYWQALLATDKVADLEKDLDEAIRGGGDRAAAARAQTMRGDVKMKRNQVDKALLDYLRTVILFENEKEAQPEALLKAGNALQQLRDPKADEIFAKLKKEYPNSAEAAKAP